MININLIVALVILSFFSCERVNKNGSTNKIKTDLNFDIKTIDSCQYIIYIGYNMCHKGDCSNKKHNN